MWIRAGGLSRAIERLSNRINRVSRKRTRRTGGDENAGRFPKLKPRRRRRWREPEAVDWVGVLVVCLVFGAATFGLFLIVP